MANNYDNAAPFYDKLSRLVFGRALVNAQVYLLQFVPPATNILIAGGGTGWILDELTRLHPTGLHITYVELSPKMMALSQQKDTGANKVTYINSAIEDVFLDANFDVVITPFLFDNFSEQTAQKVFDHLNSALKPNGLWLYADFEPKDRLWQKTLLKTMHLFFKLLCSIEASRLPEVKNLFSKRHYTPVHSKAFFHDFIRAIAYKRTG
ncbi:class I SAM-dependent methyltransferase [Mucilaginibacter calamicampi]|uniref:Class I SAM-dependent methyltransferase n=1 Tax=Mucilaginibacter calamicampi TaxID=1302352 RepID=A0ABW2YRM5_9SPHI